MPERIEVAVYPYKDVRRQFDHLGAQTRQDIAEAVARLFPQLAAHLPNHGGHGKASQAVLALLCGGGWPDPLSTKRNRIVMPTRASSHILEDLSIRRFRDVLPPAWAYRVQSPDYGIDGVVELFEDGGASTGLSFNVQLRATADARKADRVALKVEELDYYQSLDLPTIVVRYCSASDGFYWQWGSNVRSRAQVADGQKSLTHRFTDAERWTNTTPAQIRRTLDVRRSLAALPPAASIPLRLDLNILPAATRYAVDRAFMQAVADSDRALVRAGDAPEAVEVLIRPEPDFLSVAIDTITGITMDLVDPTPDSYVTSALYGLVRLLHSRRLVRQSEAVARLLAARGRTFHDAGIALTACQALARDLPALVELAIVNGFHIQSNIFYGAIALTIIKSPQAAEPRRRAIDRFFEASLAAARETESASEAATHYSISNLLSNEGLQSQAIHHFNRARRLRPAYLNTAYFLRELGGALYMARRHRASVCAYQEALARENDPDVVSRLGDALLMTGALSEARAAYADAAARCTDPVLVEDALLRLMLCDWLIEGTGMSALPHRRSEVNIDEAAHADPERLRTILRGIDGVHPVVHFGLGRERFEAGDPLAALHYFLAAALFSGSHAAWSSTALSALQLGDGDLLHRVLTVAIRDQGAAVYDELRTKLAEAGADPDFLAELDASAMAIIARAERRPSDGFTLRMLDGDEFHTMTILGLGEA